MYILGIKIYRDRSNKLIGLSQDAYIDNILNLFCHTPFRERGNEASIRVPRMFKSHVRPTIW
jgi:hypothetical protein